ncbi:MAG: helix-turn-helix domain-containing protein [Sphingobacteriales bacterium]|nr:MAG: helix-turn-helix domain-containing protein [Sphingobacteriales bacterium]
METLKPIKTDLDYQLALKKMASVFNAEANTEEGDNLEVLSLLINDYEKKNYPIEKLSPIQALTYEMQERGLSQNNLAQKFGMSKSTISEILNGKKQMSIKFLKHLHNDLGISASLLLA